MIRKLVLILAVAALGAVAGVGAVWGLPRWQARQAAKQMVAHREALFAEFQPVALANCEFERIGGSNDGGYLVCGNLLARSQAAYSYGIANTDLFGCTVSERLKIPVHQYDCFDTRPPDCGGGNGVFHAECVGPARVTEGGRLFDTIEAQVGRNGDLAKRLLVKMDVESAEWPSLLATPDSVLSQIDQLTLEFHSVNVPAHLDTIRKLKRFFHVVNIHHNNAACDPALAPFPSWAFQVLLVNKSIGVLDPSRPGPVGPNPLDAPDDSMRPDCQTAAAP
jgi:hypothetical protein